MSTLVFIPGMMCDARLFAPQIATLRAHHSCLIADITHQDSIADMAGDALALCDGPIIPIGLSMGGIVAMEMAMTAPERIEKLIVMDTNAEAEKPHIAARRAPQIEAVQNGALEQVLLTEMFPHYLPEGSDNPQIRALCRDMALALGPDVFVRHSLALRDRPDYLTQLANLTCPTLVIYGTQDRLCPPKNHRVILDAMPNANALPLDGIGHLPTLEAPDQVTAALTSFIQR